MAKDGIAPAPLGGADFDDGLDEVIAMGEAASTQSSGSKPRVTSPPPKVTYGSSPASPSVSPISSASLGGSSSSSRAASSPPVINYSSPSASPSVSPVSSTSLGGSSSSSRAASSPPVINYSSPSASPSVSPVSSASLGGSSSSSRTANSPPEPKTTSVGSASVVRSQSSSNLDVAAKPVPASPRSGYEVAADSAARYGSQPSKAPEKTKVSVPPSVVTEPAQTKANEASKARSSPYYVGQDGVERKSYDTNLAKVAVDRRASNISHTVQNAFKVMKDKLPYRAVAFQANYEVNPDSGKKYFNSFKDKIGYMLNKVTNPRGEGPVVSTHIVKGNREQNVGATDKKIIIAKGAEGWSDYEQMKSGDKFTHKTAHGVTADQLAVGRSKLQPPAGFEAQSSSVPNAASQLPDSPRLRAAALASSSSLQKTGTPIEVTAEAMGVGPRTGAVTSAELVRAQNTAEMHGLPRSDGTAALAAQFKDPSSPEKDQIQQEAIARATLDGRGSSSLGR